MIPDPSDSKYWLWKGSKMEEYPVFKLEEYQTDFKKWKEEEEFKRKLNKESQKDAEKTLLQEHFNSMTEEQRNAMRYAIFSAIEGIYSQWLG